MEKKNPHDEVDMLDLFISIWYKKKIVLSVTIIAIFFGFIYKSLNKHQPVYVIESQIKPISVFEDARYETYNSYVKSLKPLDGSENTLISTYTSSEKNFEENIVNNILQTNVVYNLALSDIDKIFLFNLFVDKITQRKNLENYMRQFKLIEGNTNKEVKLTKAILELPASVRESQIKNVGANTEVDPINIQFETYNSNQSIEFLKFLEKEVNIEIQKNLKAMFDNYLIYVESMTDFQLEDIESQLLISKDEEVLKLLEVRRKLLLSDKYIERITDIFKNSPVSESDNFYAAKIVYESDLKSSKNSMKKIIIIFGIFGAILGVIIALMSKAIELRKAS